MSNKLNILGIFFSIYFYSFLRPDMKVCAEVRLGPQKVESLINIGAYSLIAVAVCCIAPWSTKRTNVIVGNMGMAVCSVVVILIHIFAEDKWVWAGLAYVLNIYAYAFFLGLTVMGQYTEYEYTKENLNEIALPSICLFFCMLMLIMVCKNTRYADVFPCIAFGIHTQLAMIGEACCPRDATFSIYRYLRNRI